MLHHLGLGCRRKYPLFGDVVCGWGGGGGCTPTNYGISVTNTANFPFTRTRKDHQESSSLCI